MIDLILQEVTAEVALSVNQMCTALDLTRADFYRQQTPKNELDDDLALREQIQKLVEKTSPQVAISSQRGMFDPSIWNDDPITVPTQALMAQSRFWTEDYKEFAKKLVPNLDYREFQGVGHFLFMEKPDEINAAISEFLKKQNLL